MPSDGYVFNDGEQLLWKLPSGRSLTFRGSYLVRIDYPGDAYLSLYYRNGRLLEVTNSLGDITRYVWQQDDTHGQVRLISSSGPGCKTCPPTNMQYEYNSDKQLTLLTDAAGASTRYEYDDQARLIKRTVSPEPNNSEVQSNWVRYAYDDGSTVPRLIAKPSVYVDGEHIVEVAYDIDQLPVSITETGYAPITYDATTVRVCPKPAAPGRH